MLIDMNCGMKLLTGLIKPRKYFKGNSKKMEIDF
jgi:hypothetical protein